MKQFWKKASVQGATWKALAALFFALNNGLVKSMGIGLPAAQIAFLSHFFAVLWLLPFAFIYTKKAFAWRRLDLHMWRVGCSVLGVLLWYTALRFVPLAQAVALGFLGPLVTMGGSVLLLKERLTWPRGIAFSLSFVGGLFVTHLWSSWSTFQAGWPLLLPIGSACVFSLSTLLNKRLTQEQHPLGIVLSLFVPMTLLLAGFAFPVWRPMTAGQWYMAALLGAVIAGAHFSITQSFACKDLLFVLPIGALRFIITGIIGWFFFAEYPDLSICLGFVFILAALFVLGLGERKVS